MERSGDWIAGGEVRWEVVIGLIAEVEEKIRSVKRSWIPDKAPLDESDGSLMYGTASDSVDQDPAAIVSWLPFLY